MTVYTGEIRLFALDFVPSGWLPCDGSLQNVSSFNALFSLIGTTYGGDGRTTFGLPDLRARALMGAGSGSGVTPRRLGEMGGTAEVKLSPDQIARHSHRVMAAAAAPDASGEKALGQAAIYRKVMNVVVLPMDDAACADWPAAGSTPTAHENHQPYLHMMYCIAADAQYPSAH